MERFIPCRPGIDLGYGFNTLTGEVRGVSVGGEIAESTLSGQVASADAKVIESQEQLTESLDVSVEASGHYGLFSAEGRFGLAQQSGYTCQSTYVVAKCVVENAFRSFSRPTLLPEAAQRLRDDGEEAFKTSYGESFVRGLRSGGELYAVFQLTSESTTDQKNMAVSVQAGVQGLLAGGSVEANVEYLKKSSSSSSSMSVRFYQRAGRDDRISPVTTPEEIARRLKDFPTIANAAPVGYLAQIVDYEVLSLPKFDEIGFQQRTEALEDYARLKMKYLAIRSEIDLVRQNLGLFEAVPNGSDLARGYDLYTRVINVLNRHARRVAEKEIEPSLFVPDDAELKELPLFIFKKKAPTGDQVAVPNAIGLAVDAAQALLRSQGLNPTSNATAIPPNPTAVLNVVTKQTPAYGETVPKGTSVVLDYDYVASERFKWAIRRPVAASRFVVVNR
jgi:hypothetical protein